MTINGFDIASIVALIGAAGVIGKLLVDRHNAVKDFTAKQGETVAKSVAAATDLFERLCRQYSDRIDQLHKDIGAAGERITALEKQNAELRKDNEELKEQVCDLQEALDGSIAERERLQLEVDKLSTRLAKYEAKPTRNAVGK